MMNINITLELKSALELRHSKVRYGRDRDRIKAVLLRSEGWTIVMIAQALRINQSTITRHLTFDRHYLLSYPPNMYLISLM